MPRRAFPLNRQLEAQPEARHHRRAFVWLLMKMLLTHGETLLSMPRSEFISTWITEVTFSGWQALLGQSERLLSEGTELERQDAIECGVL